MEVPVTFLLERFSHLNGEQYSAFCLAHVVLGVRPQNITGLDQHALFIQFNQANFHNC